MACRVFRALLLGIIKDPHVDTTPVLPARIDQNRSADNSATSTHDKTRLSSLVINVEVEMDTRADYDDECTSWDEHSLKGENKRRDDTSAHV
jgi:hypothetical protein